MAGLISGILTIVVCLALQFWAESRPSGGSESRKKFGDGNDRYDFSDYVNEKADKDPMNKK